MLGTCAANALEQPLQHHLILSEGASGCLDEDVARPFRLTFPGCNGSGYGIAVCRLCANPFYAQTRSTVDELHETKLGACATANTLRAIVQYSAENAMPSKCAQLCAISSKGLRGWIARQRHQIAVEIFTALSINDVEACIVLINNFHIG